MNDVVKLQRRAGLAGAVLLLVGLLTGGIASFALTGKLDADGHQMLASHLNAMLGGFWVLILTATLPLLRYSHVGLTRLVIITMVPNVSNWLLTALKAFWHVRGIDKTGETFNDIIFILLDVFVVAPSLIAAAAWVYGFTGTPPNRERA